MLNGEIEVVKISQIGHWILNSFYLIVEQMVVFEFEGVAGYVENEQETRCQQEKKSDILLGNVALNMFPHVRI